MIIINFPSGYFFEKKYIVEVIFDDFLGVNYCLNFKNNIDHCELILPNNNKIIFQDHFFSTINEQKGYLYQKYVPRQVAYVSNQFGVEDDMPVLYGNDRLDVLENKITCGIDIFASSFFMLSRWEEFVNQSRDPLGRFPALASIAYKYKFLERPIVNEYVEMLWNMLISLGYQGKRKERKFQVNLTHDIDIPFDYCFSKFYRHVFPIKYLIDHLPLLFKKWYSFFMRLIDVDCENPCETFDFIMRLSEKYGIRSVFFLIANNQTKMDGNYNISSARVKKLMKYISNRGHEIGLHGSYLSYDNMEKLCFEFKKLKNICDELNIKQLSYGNRQHYLRMEMPYTLKILDDLGISYDSTLGYPERIGFRCGTCYSFPQFDFINRKKLNIIERPLIIMEASLLSKGYMGLSHQEAFKSSQVIIDRCKKYHGTFVLLWHNSCLRKNHDKKLYQDILESCFC